MTWFEDLTPYVYLPLEPPSGSSPTMNIGWLDCEHGYRRGEAPRAFAERLKVLVEHAQTQATRGLHLCDLCPPPNEESIDWMIPNGSQACGAAEIRAIGVDGTRFAAPALVHHYVTVHNYLPPQVFMEAVLVTADLSWEAAKSGDLCLACRSPMERINRGKGRCAVCGTEYPRSWPCEA